MRQFKKKKKIQTSFYGHPENNLKRNTKTKLFICLKLLFQLDQAFYFFN